MPNTTNRNWPYPNRGEKPYYETIVSTFEAQDTEVQSLWDILDNTGRRKRVVKDYVVNTAVPPTEVTDDRYLLDFTGVSHDNWDGAAAGDIVQFNGTTWDSETPVEGDIVYIDADDEDRQYVDDGIPAWETRSAGGGTSYWTRAGTTVSPVNTNDGLSVNATGNTAGVISLVANGGTTETIAITNTQGTSASAIDITAVDGGIDVDAAGVVDIETSSTNMGGAIHLNATAGGVRIESAEYIEIGMGADAGVKIGPYNTAGTSYFDVRCGSDGIYMETAGQVDLKGERVVVHGTSAIPDAIKLNASAGGIDIDADSHISIASATGALLFTATANDIYFSMNGTNKSFNINNYGTNNSLFANMSRVYLTSASSATFLDLEADGDIRLYNGSTNSIRIEAGSGGIDIDAVDGGINMDADNIISVQSTHNGANAIDIIANGGASEVIALTSMQGTGVGAIKMYAPTGGLVVDTSKGVSFNNTYSTPTGNITFTNSAVTGDLILRQTGAGTANQIKLENTATTSDDAILLKATAGGIDINAGGVIDIVAAGTMTFTDGSTTIKTLAQLAAGGGSSLWTEFAQTSISATGNINTHDPGTSDGIAIWRFMVTRTDVTGSMAEVEVSAVWDDSATSVQYRQAKTVDIGNTAGITFSVDHSGGLVRLRATRTSGIWTVSGAYYIKDV